MGVRYFDHQVQEQLSVCQWVSIHIVHNTANKGASSFALETGINTGDMLGDAYHWFDKSSKRKNTLEEFFCKFMKHYYQKIIKYISTLWLSFESAVTRILKLYPSLLQSYFLSVDKKGNQRIERLFGKFSYAKTEVYMYFYQLSLWHLLNSVCAFKKKIC